MIMLRMLTGLAMSPLTLALKILALWRRNRAESFRVSYMPGTQYRVRVELHGVHIDLLSQQATILAEALQESRPSGFAEFGSRQGLHRISWQQRNVCIQRLAETAEVLPDTISMWLNKRSAINLGTAIMEALHCHCGLCDHSQLDRHIAKDNPFVVGERVVLQHGRRGTLVGTVLFISPAGVTLKWDNGPTCSLSGGARAKDFGQLW